MRSEARLSPEAEHTVWWLLLCRAVERAARAAEREAMIADGWRQCAQGQRTTQWCGALEERVDAARAAERDSISMELALIPNAYRRPDMAHAYSRGVNDCRERIVDRGLRARAEGGA